jgi:hypothetical protein
MRLTHSVESSRYLKTEKYILRNNSSFSCGPSSNGRLDESRNRHYLFPFFEKDLRRTYRNRTRNTVAHFLRAFRFPDVRDKTMFDIENAHSLRMRLSYLYWVSIHTGEPDPDFTALFLGMYHFFGKYGTPTFKEENDCE